MRTDIDKPIDEALRENIAAETAEATAAAAANSAALMFALGKTLDELEPKVEFGEIPSDRQFFSLGKICEIFQVSPLVAREIAKRAGVRFDFACNDIPYASGDGLVEMNRYLKELTASMAEGDA